MASIDHYGIAEQYVGDKAKGSAHLTSQELAKAQVHATLALAAILRDVSAELTAIREAARPK